MGAFAYNDPFSDSGNSGCGARALLNGRFSIPGMRNVAVNLNVGLEYDSIRGFRSSHDNCVKASSVRLQS